VVADKRSLLEKAGLAKTLDFLDTLAEDVPKEMWALTVDRLSGLAIVRSLVWQGAMAYAIAGTSRYGNCYIGTGEKNLDLAFIL
jgi:radial spoke head protein 9